MPFTFTFLPKKAMKAKSEGDMKSALRTFIESIKGEGVIK